MQPDLYHAMQEQFAAHYQLILEQQRQYVDAQNTKFDRLFSMMTALQKDVAELKEANRSSSSSGAGRFVCPMQCGADFKKVNCHCQAVNCR